MKTFLKSVFLGFLPATIIFYLIFSLYQGNFNPLVWTGLSELTCVICIVLIGAIASFFYKLWEDLS